MKNYPWYPKYRPLNPIYIPMKSSCSLDAYYCIRIIFASMYCWFMLVKYPITPWNSNQIPIENAWQHTHLLVCNQTSFAGKSTIYRWFLFLYVLMMFPLKPPFRSGISQPPTASVMRSAAAKRRATSVEAWGPGGGTSSGPGRYNHPKWREKMESSPRRMRDLEYSELMDIDGYGYWSMMDFGITTRMLGFMVDIYT